MPQIAEYDRPDARTFQDEIYPNAMPAIMRGVGADLEPLRLARQSPEAFADYMKSAIGDALVNVLAARPNAGPTFFFDGGLSNLNFERGKLAFPKFVDHILGPSSDERML